MALGRLFSEPSVALPVSTFIFLLNAIFLLAYHVHAEQTRDDQPSLWERLAQGPDALTAMDKVLFGVLILLAFELLDFISNNSGKWLGSKLIPVRGKHLDELSPTDLLFIGFSKAGTAPFTYFYLRYAYFQANIPWDPVQISIQNTIVPLLALFVVFDFFYTILHWFLHIKAIYGYIHKHHHHQKAPSRGNTDAVNVHPIEFVLGEYNHLLALWICCQVFQQIHLVSAVAFLVIGGLAAGINHTRYDVMLPGGRWKIYDSKAHDVHHRIPQSNYGQYTMLWDTIFGSYRAYDPKDRVNPDAQLDPKTGKSIEYMKRKKAQ